MALGRNVGSADKAIRLIIGAVLVLWAVFSSGLGGLGTVALVIGIVLIATAVINFCPLFKILGISSFRGPSS